MTAYGAVISLKNTIDYVLRSSNFTLAEPSRKIIKPAYNELEPLQQILEELDKTSPSRSRKKVNALDGRIKDLIWEFEDLLESHVLSQQILSRSVDLQLRQDAVSPFIDILKEMKREYIHELGNMPEDDEASSSVIGFRGTNSKMIGSSDIFEQVKQKLFVLCARINVLGLVGMAGIGKTTLAEKIYKDPEILGRFRHRAWVTVGRKPGPSQLLQGVLAQFNGVTEDNINERYLIVLDDIWDTKVLDDFLSSLEILQRSTGRIYWPDLSMLGRIELVDCNPSVLTRAKEIQPTRCVHLDIVATSSVDKEPVTVTFRSYSEPEKESFDMLGLEVKSDEVVDITFPSKFVIISIIVIFGWLLKL